MSLTILQIKFSNITLMSISNLTLMSCLRQQRILIWKITKVKLCSCSNISMSVSWRKMLTSLRSTLLPSSRMAHQSLPIQRLPLTTMLCSGNQILKLRKILANTTTKKELPNLLISITSTLVVTLDAQSMVQVLLWQLWTLLSSTEVTQPTSWMLVAAQRENKWQRQLSY